MACVSGEYLIGHSLDFGNCAKMHVKSQYAMIAGLLIAVFLTASYLSFLSLYMPHNRLQFSSGLTISEYSLVSQGSIAWSDENFATGWAVSLTTSTLNDSGFISNNSSGYLYYNFTGGRVEELEIEKTVSVDTSIYKYLTVRFNATIDDEPMCFSSAVITKDSNWVGLPWNHVSRTEQILVFDITDQYSGQIKAIRFRITNDYNRNYAGGIQGVRINFASISSNPPLLGTSSYNALYTELLPHGSYFEVKGRTPPANQSISKTSIISAVYSGAMNIDLTTFHYLNLTVRTDSPEIRARVVLWTEDGLSHTVLMTNYDETRWYQVIIDLKPFGIAGSNVGKIELGYIITVGSEAKVHTIEFGQMSFIKLG